jgi:hypothetical protein
MMAETKPAPFVVYPKPPRRLSMSFLRAAEGCLRRAHLDRTAGIPSDGDALIGSLWHDCAATIGFVAVMEGAERIDVDRAVRIARRVLARPSDTGPMPRDAHRTVIELVERWCRRPGIHFRPGEVFEVLSERPLDGWLLSARLDRKWRDGNVVHVTDYKTGWADVGTKLTMQGENYAWHVCEADPTVELVVYDEDHIRFGVPNGPYEITRDDVYGPGGIDEFLRDALARIDEAYGRGELTATPGSACSKPSTCSHAKSCPVPEWARLVTVVETAEQAEIVFGSLLAQEQRRTADVARLRGYLNRTGDRAVQLGGEEIGFAINGGQTLDKKQLAADIEEGVPIVDLDDYMQPTKPGFGRRKAL